MAQLVWRYAPAEPATAHLVYVSPDGADNAGDGLASISACAEVEVPSARKWRGGAVAGSKTCPRCLGLFAGAAAAPTD